MESLSVGVDIICRSKEIPSYMVEMTAETSNISNPGEGQSCIIQQNNLTGSCQNESSIVENHPGESTSFREEEKPSNEDGYDDGISPNCSDDNSNLNNPLLETRDTTLPIAKSHNLASVQETSIDSGDVAKKTKIGSRIICPSGAMHESNFPYQEKPLDLTTSNSKNPNSDAGQDVVNASGRDRILFKYDQLKILRAHFDDTDSPGEKQMKEIAEKINLSIEQTRRWFKNQRYREKKRAAQREQIQVNASGRKRIPFRYDQLKVLRAHFDDNNRPRDEQIEEIAEKINRSIEQTRRWFVNERFCRAKKRAAQGELIQVNASQGSRKRFPIEERKILLAYYRDNDFPRLKQVIEIAEKINRPIEQIRRWFKRQRYCEKKRAATEEQIQISASVSGQTSLSDDKFQI